MQQQPSKTILLLLKPCYLQILGRMNEEDERKLMFVSWLRRVQLDEKIVLCELKTI